MRQVIDLNQDWLFKPAAAEPDAPDSAFERVTLPHTNRLFARHSVNNADYQFISTYRRELPVYELDQGQRVFIDFDGVMLACEVWLNGVKVGEHQGGFTPFSFELTSHLFTRPPFADHGMIPANRLTVIVDSTENPAIPPYGGVVDYLTFGGIYREARLRIVDTCHLIDLFPRPKDVLTAPALDCDVRLAGVTEPVQLELILRDSAGAVVARQTQQVGREKVTVCYPELPRVQLWTLEHPALYTLEAQITRNGEVTDRISTRFGFRQAEFRAGGRFYLNGEPLKLFGLNRHQTYPYIGAAAPKRLQEMDANILKQELGCNLVRCSHYAQSPHFLNRCDEIGLLVFEELAGWQHVGDEAWKALGLHDLAALIERDRHHPSIILWGVRVNESGDDEAFYTRTNALAHHLDPTRQTGGVRDFIQSQFLEDVFTLNDFPEGIQQPRVTPHLITEYGGHMFPTKSWDHEERRVEHALHHARKQNLAMGHPQVAGAIGWCAFDYHTHREFGSGDRICYHGVMDMNRLPKFAAAFYRSQKAPGDEIVLQAATNWTMGDRSGGGNNPLVVFSNCDEIELWIGDELQGRFRPDAEHYPYLPHPPFTVRWPEPYNPWGTAFSDLTVRGYLGGVLVAEQRIDAAHAPHALCLSANTDTLQADGRDMVRLAARIVDKFGNTLPYAVENVRFTVHGEAGLIGENPLILRGGQGAVFLKARHTPGEVTVCAEVDSLPPARVVLRLE